jgi:dTDP-glucose 4,6-dehydratase
MRIIVTGGSGFIGSHFIERTIVKKNVKKILNIDKLTYASDNYINKKLLNNKKYIFKKIDIQSQSVENIFKNFKPTHLINFAAETHVDNSINSADNFIKTNINGTFNLLKISKKYFEKNSNFRFLHVSTDEVFGSLKPKEKKFTEKNNFRPNSPYSASKASSDLLARSYNKTFNLPLIITNCSNNYGPRQNKEKLIPLVIDNIKHKKNIPVYGNGKNIRDWIHVYDHVDALYLLLNYGKNGETYNIGGECELNNIKIVKKICSEMNILNFDKKFKSENLIKFVNDRKGHDFRYAINNYKIYKELKWKPKINFKSGLRETIKSFLKK